ncbi:1,3-beta-glucanosyltransferase gas1, partial [Cladochytrium tenue]
MGVATPTIFRSAESAYGLLILVLMLLGTLAAPAPASAVGTIAVSGTRLVDATTGADFVVRGVAYQPRAAAGHIDDPIQDAREPDWRRDLDALTELGANVVRVYYINPAAPHGKFMQAAADRGIYLVLDLGGDASLNREKPVYDLALMKAYRSQIDAFAGFDNVLAFIAGNEVVNSLASAPAAPFVKAIIRDLKSYMRSKPRYIPIGYASSDDESIRANLLDFLACNSTDAGGDDARPDFLGLNLYEWCGKSDYHSSGYAA